MRAVSTNGLRDSVAVEALWTVSDEKDRGRLNTSNHKTSRHVIRSKEKGVDSGIMLTDCGQSNKSTYPCN